MSNSQALTLPADATLSIEKSKDAAYYLKEINHLMGWLLFRSAAQKRYDKIPVAIDEIDRIINQLGDAIAALEALGEPVPMIDLSAVPSEFIARMDIHPAMEPAAKLHAQQRLKDRIRARLKSSGTSGMLEFIHAKEKRN